MITRDKLIPAILAGVVFGTLNMVPLLTFCCFAWGLLAGAVAVFIYSRRVSDIQTSESVTVAALAGTIGGVLSTIVYFLIGTGLNLGSSAANAAKGMFSFSVAGIGLGIIFTLFSVLGGVVAAQIFRRPPPIEPPNPPSNYNQ